MENTTVDCNLSQTVNIMPEFIILEVIWLFVYSVKLSRSSNRQGSNFKTFGCNMLYTSYWCILRWFPVIGDEFSEQQSISYFRILIVEILIFIFEKFCLRGLREYTLVYRNRYSFYHLTLRSH